MCFQFLEKYLCTKQLLELLKGDSCRFLENSKITKVPSYLDRARSYTNRTGNYLFSRRSLYSRARDQRGSIIRSNNMTLGN